MERPRERELPYAWVIVALAFLALAVARGVRSAIGLVVHPWEQEFGWDRAAVSLTATFGLLVYGLTQPVAGRWADRYGPRLVFGGSLALMGVATAAMGLIRQLWQAYLTFGVGVMAAVGGVSTVPAAVAIGRWIKRRKALAVGIAMGGLAAGQLVLVPLLALLMKAWGWRAAVVWTGLGVLAVAAPLLLLLFRDDPPGSAGAPAGRQMADSRSEPLARIGSQGNFWWLIGSFWICGFTTSGLIDTHLIPYAEDIHIDSLTAATAFGALGIFNLLGTLSIGAISDRWGYKRVLGWIYLGRAVTLVFLVFVREPVTLFVFAAMFGIVDLATLPPTMTLSTTLFGLRSAGTVVGLVSLSHQLGSAAGSYAGGLIHTLAGSYGPFFLGGAGLCVAAASMSWAISERPFPSPARISPG